MSKSFLLLIQPVILAFLSFINIYVNCYYFVVIFLELVVLLSFELSELKAKWIICLLKSMAI